MNGQNLTKFCIHIIIDKIYVGIVKHHILANLQESYDPWLTSEWTKLCMKAFKYKEKKIRWHDAGHMTKMAAMPIYGTNPLKIFFSGTGRRISTKLGM